VGGQLKIRVANERRETEYVNELDILAVDHPSGTSVMPDPAGNIHTLINLVPPLSCRDYAGRNQLQSILQTDSVYWQSDLSTKDFKRDSDLRDGIICEFPKPLNAAGVKIIVNGINTDLGVFAFQKLFSLKGDNKLRWYHQLEHDPKEQAQFISWMKREGMLHISIWDGGEWKEQRALPDVGPMLCRDQCIALDLRNISGTTLKLKLESTTDLWKIDKVAADFSADQPVNITPLPIVSAITNEGADVTASLTHADKDYYTTVTGQSADVIYNDIPASAGTSRSLILKSRGYYHQWFDATGPSQDSLIVKILREPGYGARLFLPEWKKVKEDYGTLGY
jgi:hypothetical protein